MNGIPRLEASVANIEASSTSGFEETSKAGMVKRAVLGRGCRRLNIDRKRKISRRPDGWFRRVC